VRRCLYQCLSFAVQSLVLVLIGVFRAAERSCVAGQDQVVSLERHVQKPLETAPGGSSRLKGRYMIVRICQECLCQHPSTLISVKNTLMLTH
jgi:hypothetical protein